MELTNHVDNYRTIIVFILEQNKVLSQGFTLHAYTSIYFEGKYPAKMSIYQLKQPIYLTVSYYNTFDFSGDHVVTHRNLI